MIADRHVGVRPQKTAATGACALVQPTNQPTTALPPAIFSWLSCFGIMRSVVSLSRWMGPTQLLSFASSQGCRTPRANSALRRLLRLRRRRRRRSRRVGVAPVCMVVVVAEAAVAMVALAVVSLAVLAAERLQLFTAHYCAMLLSPCLAVLCAQTAATKQYDDL